MDKPTKQLRVHNWSGIFLERLNEFYSKTDHCDVTLQFEGNAQLKVHRLVLNVCSNFFGPSIIHDNINESGGEAIVIMPPDLQADVMLPIINFMYTGLLDYETSMFTKLYKAADILHMPVLTKLLDSQRTSSSVNLLNKNILKRKPLTTSTNTTLLNAMKKFRPLTSVPSTSPSSSTSSLLSKRKKPTFKFKSDTPSTGKSSSDQAKPFRFDWPDDYEPEVRPTDVDFGSIPKKAIITYSDYAKVYGNEEMCANNNNSPPSSTLIDIDSMKDYVKEQKIRSDLMHFEKDYDDDYNITKIETKITNKKDTSDEETTLTIKMKNIETELDHTKIISEVLKKFPDIVKKNKNIRLKIMSDSPKQPQKTIKLTSQLQEQQTPKKSETTTKQIVQAQPLRTKRMGNLLNETNLGPWKCTKCAHYPEFALYYLYRKHMIDEHNEHYDNNQCKYCGKKCKSQLLLEYHTNTEHNLQSTKSYNFPKCQQCAYIAPTAQQLTKHTKMHTLDEIKCNVCELVFINKQMILKHFQITNHSSNTTGNSSKNRQYEYDCQYCMKRYKAAMNLYTHIKQCHGNEGERDGILLYFDLDVDGDTNTNDDDNLINQNQIKNKVNIISDIKVDHGTDKIQHLETIDASDLSNVANSLGLVDIVVFNEDDQQYILQQHQPSQIITTTSGTTANTSDITSTDELVMVLTDHDYNNEGDENIIQTNDGENGNNSNIVVLYSHPCDATGQQSFITTQGNLLVNSETGLIEIRQNPTTSAESIVTATAAVAAPGQETPIESIEMIQREIESHIQQESETTQQQEQEQLQEAQPMHVDETSDKQSEFISNEITAKPNEENLNEEKQKETPNVDYMELGDTTSFELNSNSETQQELLNKNDNNEPTVESEQPEEEQKIVDEQEQQQQQNESIESSASNSDEIQLTDNLTTIIDDNEEDNHVKQEPKQDKTPAVVEQDNETIVEEPQQQSEEEKSSEVSQSNISNMILDDWDDTDSQQSDKPNLLLMKENVADGGNTKDELESNGIKSKQTVNKIMDEWDINDEMDNEDEEDIKKETVSNDL